MLHPDSHDNLDSYTTSQANFSLSVKMKETDSHNFIINATIIATDVKNIIPFDQ